MAIEENEISSQLQYAGAPNLLTYLHFLYPRLYWFRHGFREGLIQRRPPVVALSGGPSIADAGFARLGMMACSAGGMVVVWRRFFGPGQDRPGRDRNGFWKRHHGNKQG